MIRRRIVFTAEARAQSRRAVAWWRENRSASEGLLQRELREAIALAGRSPNVGARYPSQALPNVRRLTLRKTRFHVYYLARGDQITS